MLVSNLIPQIDPHVKTGSEKVSRQKMLKEYTSSRKRIFNNRQVPTNASDMAQNLTNAMQIQRNPKNVRDLQDSLNLHDSHPARAGTSCNL